MRRQNLIEIENAALHANTNTKTQESREMDDIIIFYTGNTTQEEWQSGCVNGEKYMERERERVKTDGGDAAGIMDRSRDDELAVAIENERSWIVGDAGVDEGCFCGCVCVGV